MFRFYRFIRRHTKPVPFHTADKWHTRLSYGYIFCGWNAFLIAVMLIYKSDGKLKSEPLESYVKKLEIPKATLITINGLSGYKVSEYTRADGILSEEFKDISSSTPEQQQPDALKDF